MKGIYDDLIDSPKEEKKKKSDNFSSFKDEIDFDNSSKQLKDKITSIRSFLDSFQKRLEGYEYVASLDKISYTGRVLCGSLAIQKLVSLLSPFSENSNLIGEGKIEDYYKDKHETHTAVNEILLGDMSVPAENYKTILKMFKNNFKKIGNIVNTSRDLMRGQFASIESHELREGDL